MSADIHYLDKSNSLSAVRGLLRSLVPRATCFCLYDIDAQCTWSSDGADDHELDSFVAELPIELIHSGEKEPVRRTLPSGRTALVMPVGDDRREPLGSFVTVFSKNAGKSSWFNPRLLREILVPAVDVMSRLLVLGRRLEGAEQAIGAVDDELKLVYSIDKKVHNATRRHAGLAQLIGQSGRFMGIAYSVLLLPAKRIRISATHSTWKDVNRRAVDRYIVETLMPQMETAAGPVVFDIEDVEGADAAFGDGCQAMLSPLRDAKGALEGVVAQIGRVCSEDFDDSHKRFMAHIVRKVEYVIEQSFDPMTGLMNRAGFEAQLKESGRNLSADGYAHQIVYFDLDNLQLVNDTFGRDAGDQVLMRFSQILETVLPRNAVATRLTGDDFAILITHASLEDALAVANDVRAQSDRLRYLKGSRSLQVTVSIGISAFDLRSSEGDALTAARIACEKAKDHGRDRIEIHDQDDQSIIRRYDDMQLIARVQKALDNDEFQLLAQPIVPAAAPDSIGRFEILLRMQNSKGDSISSKALVSAAERYHLMPHIDRWVVQVTLRTIRERTDELVEAGTSFAINLSGQSLGDDDMLEFIEDELDSAGIPPSLLAFEITESAAVSNIAKAQALIARLRERGCRFSLDDFGAGLSSFAYLKNLTVDTLKIDGGFIRGIVDDRIAESMVAAITQVAKVMELETVAEFVEDEATIDLLADMGVSFLQGHAVGRPAPLLEVLESNFGEVSKSA